MSYILDALNKSENDRRAAAIPGMAAGASFMVAPQKKAAWHGGAAILVGVGMLATGLALGNWRPWQQVPAVPPVELAAAAPVAPMPVATTPAATAPAAVAPAAVAPPAANPPPLVEATAAVAPALELPKALAPSAEVLPAGQPSAKALAQLKPQPTMPAVSKPKAPPKPPPTVLAKTPAKGAPAKVAQAVPEEAPAAHVVAYRELPAKVQSRLPAISFGGFAGVDESEVKIAFINNRLVKEGEEVSPGLKLEKVGSDGVVLAYQGHRFRP